MFNGSVFVTGVVAWHARHDLTFDSTLLSIYGNQTFSLNSFFVLIKPWCPSCAMSITFVCKLLGITILSPRNKMSVSSQNESSSLIVLKIRKEAMSMCADCFGICHELVTIASLTAWRVGSLRVASEISFFVIALGMSWSIRKLTYSSATVFSCFVTF